MRVFTEPRPQFERVARFGRVRYDWRRHRYICTCEVCGATVALMDRYGNDFRTQQEYDDFGCEYDRVRGLDLYYGLHGALLCPMSASPIGSSLRG